MVLSGICIICILSFYQLPLAPPPPKLPPPKPPKLPLPPLKEPKFAAATAETSEKYGRDSSTSMATCGIPFFLRKNRGRRNRIKIGMMITSALPFPFCGHIVRL